MADIITCSTKEVVVTQLPVRAVIRPRITDTDETKKAMCIVSAFMEGLAIDNPPEATRMAPKSRGNRAVMYPVAAKKPTPSEAIMPPVRMDSCGMLKPAIVYLVMKPNPRVSIL